MFSRPISWGVGGLEIHAEVYSEVHSNFYFPERPLVQGSLQLWALDLAESNYALRGIGCIGALPGLAGGIDPLRGDPSDGQRQASGGNPIK